MVENTPFELHSNGEIFSPSSDFLAKLDKTAWDKKSKLAQKDMLKFWAERAGELEWYKPWTKVLDDSSKPFYKWFVDGKVNIVHNCLDRYAMTWRRNKLALIWEGETGEQRAFSYHSLNREVCKFASVIKAMGITKGDRVTIYLPRIPEIVIAMLACAKIGAVHSVVYGGFSVESLHGRILDSHSKIAITADGGWMNGKIVKLKDMMDEALQPSPSVEHVIVIKRTGQEVAMEPERDLWYHDLMSLPIASPKCETEVLDAEDPLYILYTSGTTGKPKAVLHTHGGYMVGIYSTLRDVFDLKDEDRWWC